MTTQLIPEVVLGLALFVWVVYRQFTWRRVNPARVWIMPAIVALIGLLQFAQVDPTNVHPLDFVLLSGEALVGLATGAAMGLLARFRPGAAASEAAAGPLPASGVVARAAGLWEARTGWLGAMLWLVMIAARVGIGFWGASQHATLVDTPAIILIMLALNRAARAAVLLARVQRLGAAPAA